jgi:geranylgeranyl diphosphate synthase type I
MNDKIAKEVNSKIVRGGCPVKMSHLGQSGQDLQMKMNEIALQVGDELRRFLDWRNLRLEGRPQKFARGLLDHAYYYPSLGGKRMRPIITIVTGQLFGEANEALSVGAASVELVHNFTLMHDDIMDKDETRRGRKTAHEAFGVNSALNAGDYLFALAMVVACEAERLANVKGVAMSLARTVTDVSIGQQLDVEYENVPDVTVPEYLKMVEKKTATLFECSCEIGGILGGMKGKERLTATSDQIGTLRSFGLNLGLAFQIRDDYLGTFGDTKKIGKPVGNDLRRGKKNYVVIAGLGSASSSQRERLEEVLGKNSATDAQISDALGVLRTLGIDMKCQELAQDYMERAISYVSGFDVSESREFLERLSKYAVTREA